MTKLRVINRELEVFNLDGIEGTGDSVVVVVSAERRTKAGTPERHNLRLKICRFGVMQFLRELAKMHVRDRDRLIAEKLRIEHEINALQVRS